MKTSLVLIALLLSSCIILADSVFPSEGIYVAKDSDNHLFALHLDKTGKERFVTYTLRDRYWQILECMSGPFIRTDNQMKLPKPFDAFVFAYEMPIDQNGNQHEQIVLINTGKRFPPNDSFPFGKCFLPFTRVDLLPQSMR